MGIENLPHHDITPHKRRPSLMTESEFKSGDVEAFERIKWPMMASIRKVNPSLSLEDMEDIFQQTLEKAWAKQDSYIPGRGAGFDQWIFAIAHNSAVDYLRKRNYHNPVSLENEEYRGVMYYLEDKEQTPEEAVVSSEEKKEVHEALNQLPHEQREVIELNFFKELSQIMIADSTSIPLGTIKTRQRLGYEKLRNLLPHEEVTSDI